MLQPMLIAECTRVDCAWLGLLPWAGVTVLTGPQPGCARRHRPRAKSASPCTINSSALRSRNSGAIIGLSLLLGCGEAAGGDSMDPGDASWSGDVATRADGGGSIDLVDASCTSEGEEHFPDAGSMHVSRFRDSELTYADLPPTGGTHSECWADYGVYAEELEDARWVHSLEHGGIVLLYRCPDGCPDELAQLEEFVASHPRTILTPYAALPTRFGAVAWEYRLLNPCFDLPSLERFYIGHFNKARENIASGPPDLCAQ